VAGAGPSSVWIACSAAAAFALSAASVWAAIRYARRRRLIDLPGQRRSHRVPTPRGGGIGIVAAILLVGLALAATSAAAPMPPFLWLLPAVAAIALVGWIDDHGGLAARTRLATHCAAAAWALAAPFWLGGAAPLPPGWPYAALLPVLLLALAWSVNLHNFMDGIDGLLAMQSLFVFATVAWLLQADGSAPALPYLSVWAAAVAGFVPFNFPRARIFMGDVGSGVLGFLVGVAVLWQLAEPQVAWPSGIVACSAFVADATCTLLSRMLRGRRWYSAHREHLYQWLARSGFSHAQVVALYMSWNLLIVLPVVYCMNRASVPHAPALLAGGVYALAVVLWCGGKRWCLRSRRRHAA
jgi:UDP-N-acetylmuramyl pentapeptide phosphotransferase/UDP-N-acetylglucosamine-1-phosphate transferase